MCLFDLRFGFYDTQNDVAKLDKCAKCTVPAICGNTCFWLLHHCGMHSMVACGLLSWRVSPKNEKTVNLLHLVISTRRRSGNREPIGGIGIGTRTGSDFTTGTSREYSEYRFTSITTRLKSSPVSGSLWGFDFDVDHTTDSTPLSLHHVINKCNGRATNCTCKFMLLRHLLRQASCPLIREVQLSHFVFSFLSRTTTADSSDGAPQS